MLFIDKYRPKSVASIIGHKRQINHIYEWLKFGDGGSIFLIGQPGIGKTLIIQRIAKKLGYKLTEYNACEIEKIEDFKPIKESTSIKRLKKEALVIDNLDGLSVRGGVAEIVTIIKSSKVPIICIADQKTQKLTPIATASTVIKLTQPPTDEIVAHLSKVIKKENIKISQKYLEKLCGEKQNDIRALLTHLQFHCNDIQKSEKTNLSLDIFSATKKLVGNRRISLEQSNELVFIDYSMIPLMVQESYIKGTRKIENCAMISEMICYSDILDHRIHAKNDWGLLPNYVTTISLTSRMVPNSIAPSFPSWLGKNSKMLKNQKLLSNMSLRMKYSPDMFRLDYANNILNILGSYLLAHNPDIKLIINIMDKMKLTRDDLIEILPDIVFTNVEIPKTVKTTLTREYNKKHSSKEIVIKKTSTKKTTTKKTSRVKIS
jgi:replication factor C subunit 1